MSSIESTFQGLGTNEDPKSLGKSDCDSFNDDCIKSKGLKK